MKAGGSITLFQLELHPAINLRSLEIGLGANGNLAAAWASLLFLRSDELLVLLPTRLHRP